jgi:hypothetical protein
MNSIKYADNINYLMKKTATKELALSELESTVDFLEIRLWAKLSLSNHGQLMVIKQIDKQWVCIKYDYIAHWPAFVNGMSRRTYLTNYTIDTFVAIKKLPKSNWKSFFKAVEKQRIYDLPDQSEIKYWQNEVSDGNDFWLEYATKNKYSFASYNCPDYYENVFIECKRMTNIIEIFNTEFGLFVDNPNSEKDEYTCCSEDRKLKLKDAIKFYKRNN